MQVNPLLLAAFVVALPLAVVPLWLVLRGRRWRTYWPTVDVGRPPGERPDDEAFEDPLAGRPSKPVVRGPRGLRGWLRRRLYPFYRR